ncbi:MAG: ABC transporter substrate-binding protein [Anaerolineaceae bacterium]
MKKFWMGLVGLLIISSVLLAACQPAATETAQGTAPAVEEEVTEAPAEETAATEEQPATEAPADGVVTGGTLYWHSGAIVSFDPPFIVDDPSFAVVSQIYSFLFRIDGEGNILPDLAESWEYENDNKTVVFHLRQGVTFQDGNDVFAEGEGREVVASDVAYSIERYLTVEGGQPTSDLVANFESVEAVDDYTVRLNLKNPDALLFVLGRGLTSLGIVPQEAVEFYGDTWNIHPIGSGPFELQEYTPDDQIVLKANEDHYIVPNLAQVIFKIIPDETVASISLEAEEIYYLATSTTTIFEQFVGREGFRTEQGDCPWNYYIHYDFVSPLTSQIEIRKAVSQAINGEEIMKAILGNLYIGGCGTAGPGVPGYDADLCSKYFLYDTEAAAQTLTDAGWTKNASGIWEKDGTPLALRLEIWNLTPTPDIGAAIITQLQEFGVDAELVQVEFGTWIDDFYGGNQKEMMFSNGFCGDGGLNALFGGGGLAYALGYTNEEASALLDQANMEVDPAKRDEMLRTAQDMVYSDYVAYTLGFGSGGVIINEKVQDFEPGLWFLNLVTTKNNVWVAE